MAFIEQSELLAKTNGGLEIIMTYYPQVRDAIATNRKEFKIRDNERTPSARIKQLADGNWVVTDFGDDSTPRNGIQICMREEEISYREAIVKLAGRYGIGGINPEINRPSFEKRPARADETEGETYFEIKDEISEKELAELGPCVKLETCKKYNVYALHSFTYIKNREAQVTTGNENYPIFLVDHGEFKKIYQPKNPDKGFRFRYSGIRPKDFVNGLKQVEKAFSEINEDFDPESEDKDKKRMKKLPEIIIASGERDALNVAGLGYQVIWLNSETAALDQKLYQELTKMADEIYNIPDIDATGRKQAIKLGLQYLDIKTVWLPEKLADYRDHRGKPRKDFRDYVEIWPKLEDFKKIMRVAPPMRFWDETYTDSGIKYSFNNEHAYHFLQGNGFYQLENKNEKDGMMFVKLDHNIVSRAEAEDCRKFLQAFMRDRFLPIPLKNMVHRSNQLSESSLKGLKVIQLDFTDFDRETQYLFFENRTWKVKAAGITEQKPVETDRYVWREEVMPHKVTLQDPMFEIKFDADDQEYDIKIGNTDSHFFKMLINTSRVHWKAEYITRSAEGQERDDYREANRWNIAGPKLEYEEVWEQKQHLINKIFSIGYLLHRYKDAARPWCVFAMDNKITDTGESHGRSGKSVAYRAVRHFMKSVFLNGRNPKLTDNPHIFDRVTEHVDFILIDDANEYLNFGFFFNAIQGDLEVNPKNNKSYEIPFKDVPKFCITSNFTLRNIDPSTEGRILYTVFSDYYHIKTSESDDYDNDLSIRDDIGKNLWDDYDEKEWNDDINFFARCLQFYLSVPRGVKLGPPMDNVTKRNLRTEMTEPFKNWADVYFDQYQGNCDRTIERESAFKNFEQGANQHRWTTNKFTKALKAWCKYTEYVIALNPEELRNSSGRIIRKNSEGQATEMIYVQTKELTEEVKTPSADDIFSGNFNYDNPTF